jgi:hypothetical protein
MINESFYNLISETTGIKQDNFCNMGRPPKDYVAVYATFEFNEPIKTAMFTVFGLSSEEELELSFSYDDETQMYMIGSQQEAIYGVPNNGIKSNDFKECWKHFVESMKLCGICELKFEDGGSIKIDSV